MATVEVDVSEQSEAILPAAPTSTVKRGGLLDDVRQLAYAWVGLWGVAGEDIGNFYDRCVARGEQILNARPPMIQPEVKSSPPDITVNQPKTAGSRNIRPLSIFNAFGAVESYHFDLNAEGLLPTKQEFDALNERVEVLAREVDALAKQRE